jgi:glycosyltransferase involved in cell wall biosynthesis
MRILVTSNHGNTFNPKGGSDIRKHNLVMELCKHNEMMVLESNRYADDQIHVPPNIMINYYKEYYFFGKPLSYFTDFNPSFISKIIKMIRSEDVDIIQNSFLQGALAIKFVILIMRRKIPLVYDAHDVVGDTVKQIPPSLLPYPIRYFLLIYLPFLERLVTKYTVDHIITTSNEDKNRLIQKYGITEEKINVIPSGSKIIDSKSLGNRNRIRNDFGVREDEIIVLFHGTYSYYPNKEAFDIIIKYIAPTIRIKFKNVLFLLAGSNAPVFDSGNVKSIGFVNDLKSLLRIADIAIVPILRGSGTRLKILDYMAFSLPIVTTKKGMEGIEMEDGEEANIVENVDEKFINAIENLINNIDERKRIGKNGQKLLMNKYDKEKIGEQLDILYNSIHKEMNNIEPFKI